MRKKHDLQTVCQKALRALRSSPRDEMSRSALLRKLHVDSGTLADIEVQLTATGEVGIERVSTAGRPQTFYKALPQMKRDSRLEQIGRLIAAAVRLAVASE
jgi:hypothetical protein